MVAKDIREPVCYRCANYILWPYCIAFPDGIPQDVREGLNDHSEPIEGDHGLQFEPITLELAERHLGPGPHPSGSEQQVHAGGRGTEGAEGAEGAAARWDPSTDNVIDYGHKLALNDEIDETKREPFGEATRSALRKIWERTGIKPKGLILTNSHLTMADAVIAGQRYPGLDRIELAGVLADSTKRGVVGSHEDNTIWLNDKEIGSEKWMRFLYHEYGHALYDQLDEIDSGPTSSFQHIVNVSLTTTNAYWEASRKHYPSERINEEYFSDLVQVMITQDNPKTWERYKIDFNKFDRDNMEALRDILEVATMMYPEISRSFTKRREPEDLLLVISPEMQEAWFDTREAIEAAEMPAGVEVVDIHDVREPFDPVPREVRKAISGFISSLKDIL